MGSVTGMSAARMLEIENASVVSGQIVGSDLILTRHDGLTINAGEVKGEPGLNGVTPIWRATSTESLVLGTGNKTFTLFPAMNLPFVAGAIVKATSTVDVNDYMVGVVTAASTTSVTIDVTETGGDETAALASWILTLGAFKGVPGDINVSPAGGVLSGNYPDPIFSPLAVTTEAIADGAITREKLAVGSVYAPDLIKAFIENAPLIFAHRGAHNLYPENSLEGMRATADAGFVPELDLRILSTGQIVACHDATVDRTMTGTGSVSALSLSDWRKLSIKPQIQNGQMAQGALWEDILSDMGGRFLLAPEVKVAGTQAALMETVIARNLQRAVIFQSFDLDTAQAIAAAGCTALYLVGSSLSAITPEELVASGVEFIGFEKSVTAASLTAAKDAGLHTIVYTVDTMADYLDTIDTKEADGVFTDDPWFVADRVPVKSSDPFQSRDAWPHLVGYTSGAGVLSSGLLCSTRLQYAPPIGLRRYDYAQDPSTLAISMGFAGQERGPQIRVRFTVTFLEGASSQSRWCGVFIGTQDSPDTVYHDSALAGQNGYHCLVRRSGILEIFRVSPGAAPVNIATSSTPGTALANAGARSQPNRIEIVIGAANVSITNLTTGLTTTVASTAYRGLSRIDFTANNTDLEWQSIGIEDIN